MSVFNNRSYEVTTVSGVCYSLNTACNGRHEAFLRTRSNQRSPFIRDGDDKLVRRPYWMDMDDRTFVMVMTKGIGAHLTNDEKRAHLADLRREHLIDQVCVQEILPPESEVRRSPTQ